MARAKLGPRTAVLGTLVCLLVLATSAHGQGSAGPRRFLVRYRADVSTPRQRALAGHFGLRERKQLRARRLAVVELPSSADADRALAALRAQPEVEYAVPDVRMQMTTVPNDPGFSSQWWLANPTDTDIDAPQGWDVRRDAPGVVVAVVDSGVDALHEDLAANLWTNPGEVRNGLDDDGNGYVDDLHGIDCVDGVGDPVDDNGHGTHVAGTIAAVGNNGRGVTGVAWRAQIMALKALDADGGGWYSDAVECIDYALVMKTRGVNVRVLNASWGAPDFDEMLQDAFKTAGDLGILSVAAAGNDGLNHTQHKFYPASFPLDGLLAVAATTDTGALANFSDYGPDVEIAAPGVFILSTLPGDLYGYLSGTSMASPQVAGAAALLAGLDPGTSVAALRERLLSSADRTAPLKGKVTSGRLNLGAALRGAATVPLTGLLPVAGKKLALSDVAGGAKAKLALSVKDFSIGPPVQGGASDPTLYGGELVVRNPESGQTIRVPLEASGWRFAKKSYQYKGTTGCKVLLKAGVLTAKCAGPAWRFPLEAPVQRELTVALVLGPARLCSDFGGTVAKDFGIGSGPKPTKGAFAATAAPAPPICPAD